MNKIYRIRNNLAYCKERNIRLSGPALGRPRKDAVIDKKTEYRDNADRVEVMGSMIMGLDKVRKILKHFQNVW